MSTVRSRTTLRALAGVAAVATALMVAGCASSTTPPGDTAPLTIGASLPLTGPVADRSGPGLQGYELWAEAGQRRRRTARSRRRAQRPR